MSADRRVALSNFYREEFLRHIEHLQATGILDDEEGAAVSRARQAVLTRLDDVCSLASFPALAESLLQPDAVDASSLTPADAPVTLVIGGETSTASRSAHVNEPIDCRTQWLLLCGRAQDSCTEAAIRRQERSLSTGFTCSCVARASRPRG